jgi:hypothetical protein
LLPAMAGLPPFISFSTSYRELNSAVLRHTGNEQFVGKQEVMAQIIGITSGLPVRTKPPGSNPRDASLFSRRLFDVIDYEDLHRDFCGFEFQA